MGKSFNFFTDFNDFSGLREPLLKHDSESNKLGSNQRHPSTYESELKENALNTS